MRGSEARMSVCVCGHVGSHTHTRSSPTLQHRDSAGAGQVLGWMAGSAWLQYAAAGLPFGYFLPYALEFRRSNTELHPGGLSGPTNPIDTHRCLFNAAAAAAAAFFSRRRPRRPFPLSSRRRCSASATAPSAVGECLVVYAANMDCPPT